MPSTVVHALLPGSCWVVSEKKTSQFSKRQWIAFTLIAVLLANFPDMDLIPAFLFPNHFYEIHRAWGHNVFSLFLFSLLGSWLLRRFVSSDFTKQRAWMASVFLVGSHVVLDAAGQYNSYGFLPSVPLFWPFSEHAYRLPIRVFVTLDLAGAPNRLYSLIHAPSLLGQIFVREVIPSIIVFGLWCFGVFAYSYFKKMTFGQPDLKEAQK